MKENMQTQTSGELIATSPAPQIYGNKRDVANMVKLSTRSVDNLLAAGLPHIKLGKRRVRFNMVEVDKWIQAQYGVQRRTAR